MSMRKVVVLVTLMAIALSLLAFTAMPAITADSDAEAPSMAAFELEPEKVLNPFCPVPISECGGP